ncbi:helix-turn-helix domain-containing protein [Rhizobium laguerreae]|uniref:helix-turn-helix transcriptional regulator n=1 Tax=Rhizobium TaxID=379 RepID=UPI001039F3CE|nr:helix-turn-helix domain-containing protein [Rhizobium ruizarguesonis]NKJ76914.1 helix-turn-helix domain-containing protein [Rhizobium leguminosarum bv. viciae]TBX74440.1 helix-turn-helix domain-containing protein [Rhizobium laguerreae]NKQ73873.1 XRE family transcriptional regulator [Rhizobium ruizarguesonis]NKQ82339.1 XRE family transcriptional regulator [Rhizobium ruizarguesonis]TBY13037.1 helix-turn-helix domain-containing protein [Rhizobium laguerreae]
MQTVPRPILKIAREFLGLSQDDVEAVVGVSRKTIQRIERGDDVIVHYVASLQRFYEDQGIEFVPPADDRGWGVFNANTKADPAKLNTLENIPPSKRRKTES